VSAVLKIVCTDQGQHPERLLGKLTRGLRDKRLSVVATSHRRSNADERHSPITDTRPTVPASVVRVVDGSKGGTRRVVQFTCSTCRRSPRLADDKLEQVIAAGLVVLDISTLPL
jgi:hypothetical protein